MYEQENYEYEYWPSMSRRIMNMTTDQWASGMSTNDGTKYEQDDNEYDYWPSMMIEKSMNTYQVWAGGLWTWLLTKFEHR